MTETLRPASESELTALLAEASFRSRTLFIRGGQSHAMLGRPIECERILDTTALTGPLDYDPTELVLTAPSGTPLTMIEQTLAAHNHMLAVETPALDWLSATPVKGGTVGGLVATNMAGSRRISAGAVRDHVLGVRAVTGKGLVFKSGGRVVKNVTGYDLSKLLSGSFGTLAVLSEVTLRVVPRPEDALTILISAVDIRAAVGMLADALACAQAVSGAAYLPGDILPPKLDLPGLETGQGWVALRLEGFSETLPARRDALLAGLDDRKPDAILSSLPSADLWKAIGAGCLLSDPAPSMLWRVSIPPSAATEFVAAFDAGQGWRYLLDWGGGLVWLAYAGSTELTEGIAASLDQALRRSLAKFGGHGALLRAPDAWRDRLNAFQPLSSVEMALSRRTKAAFDPDSILNPRFMHPEL